MSPSRLSDSPVRARRPVKGRAQRGRALARLALDGPQQSARHNLSTHNRAIDFAHLKRLVSLPMVLAHYGILDQFKRQGTQLIGACPLHHGSNPKQFVVHPTTGNFFCFGDCKRGGAGALEFVSLRENVPITTAAQLVAQWFAVPPSPRPPRPQQQRRSSMTTRPSHKAFVVEDRQGDANNEQGGFWTRCGSAWPHKDGKGLNIQIATGLAVSGRLVLREYTEEDEASEAKKVTRTK
jgi:CHC2-type zinc finger protein